MTLSLIHISIGSSKPVSSNNFRVAATSASGLSVLLMTAICRLLESNNIDYRFHDYRVDGLDNELLDVYKRQAQRSTHTVHRGVAAAQYHDVKSGSIDKRLFR